MTNKQSGPSSGLLSTITDIQETFYENELSQLDDLQNNLDFKINYKVSQCMKKASLMIT